MVTAVSAAATVLCRDRILRIERRLDPPRCVLLNGAEVIPPRSLIQYLQTGDQIAFPISTGQQGYAELYVVQRRHTGRDSELFYAPLPFVGGPAQDKRGESFLAAEVRGQALGIGRIVLSSEAVREYFYRGLPTDAGASRESNFYQMLGMPLTASVSELRLAYKIRLLELQKEGAEPSANAAVERAFNILGHPEFRACYDALLRDPESQVVFPYGGLGTILVSGNRSQDGNTFFARRILWFRPDVEERRFRAPLRRFEFYGDRALYKDRSRKLEVWLDQALLHTVWDPTWNQWKQFLGTKIEIQATFVAAGRYRKKGGSWELESSETALPSRIKVRVPGDLEQQAELARRQHQRFGRYAEVFEEIRAYLQEQPLEKADLQRLCDRARVPADFDVAQITWHPDYDLAYYRQLTRWSKRLYLFRTEYIFELDHAVVIETPQVGHATYLFRRPSSMDDFLLLYTKLSKDDIRRNRNNAAEKLSFIGRVLHGRNPRSWLKDLRRYLGEVLDYADTSQLA
jgi:hypothetical protein